MTRKEVKWTRNLSILDLIINQKMQPKGIRKHLHIDKNKRVKIKLLLLWRTD